MKKVIFVVIATLFLNGCFQVIAMVGPAATGVSSGNIYQSVVSYSVNYGIKKSTGKTIVENVIEINKDGKSGKKVVKKVKEVNIFKNSFNNKSQD